MVKQHRIIGMVFFLFCLLSTVLLPTNETLAAKEIIFDQANVLSENERYHIEELATKYGTKRDTNYVVLTTDDTKGKDIVDYAAAFYDEHFSKTDTVILAVDMDERRVNILGFNKGEEYLDNERADLILDKIQPMLAEDDYYEAMQKYVKTAYKYMGIRPGINPENLFLQWWFQIGVSIGLAILIVGTMMYNSGGKVTVNSRTYMNPNASKVLDRRDVFLRKSVTRRRKPKNKNGGPGNFGGGGGVTPGGQSFSSGRTRGF